jgi:hypothetical protein
VRLILIITYIYSSWERKPKIWQRCVSYIQAAQNMGVDTWAPRKCDYCPSQQAVRRRIGTRVLLIEDDNATAQSIELMLKFESFNV